MWSKFVDLAMVIDSSLVGTPSSTLGWLAYKGDGTMFPARESRTLSFPTFLTLLPSAVVDPRHVGNLC